MLDFGELTDSFENLLNTIVMETKHKGVTAY